MALKNNMKNICPFKQSLGKELDAVLFMPKEHVVLHTCLILVT